MTTVSVGWRVVVALPILALILLWQLSSAPLLARTIPLVLLALAVWRPGVALVGVAAVAPLAGILGLWVELPVHGARLYEQLAAAVILASVITHRPFAHLRLVTPGVALILLVITSAIVVMPSWWLLDGLQPTVAEQWAMLRHGELFALTSSWRPVHAALLITLGVGVALITEQTLRSQAVTGQTLMWAVVGGGIVAATLNLARVYELASMRDAGVLELFSTVRLNTQLDINAAGSIFALLIVGGVGLLAHRGWPQWLAGAALGVMTAGGLWLSGSRAAMVAVFVATLGALVIAAVRSHPEHRRRVLAGIAVVVLLGAAAVAAYPSSRNFAVSKSVESRLILYRVAVDMWRDAPVMGMGIGTFAGRSVEYGSAAIDAILVTGRVKENAHNYFLQVLAELGVVGLVVFVWLLTAALWPVLVRGATTDTRALWMAGGVCAYLITSLTGHPQLLSEAVFPFWLVLGGVAGSWVPSPASADRRHTAAVILAVLAVMALIATAPARISHLRDHAQLEHRGVGVSLWQTSEDGLRYRVATDRSTVFIPTGGTIDLPLRLADGSASAATVEVWVDDVRVNQIGVSSDGWTIVRLSLRQAKRRFVGLRLSGPSEATFWIGRPDVRPLH